MNTTRKFFGFLIAVILAAFVLPAGAATDSSKTYSVGGSSGSAFPATSISTGVIRYRSRSAVKNNSHVSSSNLNSFQLTAPPRAVTILSRQRRRPTITYRTSSFTIDAKIHPRVAGKSTPPCRGAHAQLDMTVSHSVGVTCTGGGQSTAQG